MNSNLFEPLFTPEFTIPNTTSTTLLISIISGSLSALTIGVLFVVICAIICLIIYRYKSKVKSSVTSIELNGILSNHCSTENNHDPTTKIQLGYENIGTNNLQLLSNPVYGCCAIDDYIDITDNTLIMMKLSKIMKHLKQHQQIKILHLYTPYPVNIMVSILIRLLKMRLIHWDMMRLIHTAEIVQ